MAATWKLIVMLMVAATEAMPSSRFVKRDVGGLSTIGGYQQTSHSRRGGYERIAGMGTGLGTGIGDMSGLGTGMEAMHGMSGLGTGMGGMHGMSGLGIGMGGMHGMSGLGTGMGGMHGMSGLGTRVEGVNPGDEMEQIEGVSIGTGGMHGLGGMDMMGSGRGIGLRPGMTGLTGISGISNGGMSYPGSNTRGFSRKSSSTYSNINGVESRQGETVLTLNDNGNTKVVRIQH